MAYPFTEKEIERQRQLVFGENPSIELEAPCKIGDGILRFSNDEKEKYSLFYSLQNVPVCFFIPASGSGSRMFAFLYEFLEQPNEENRSKVERFLNAITEFAFFKNISREMQREILNQSANFEKIVAYILKEEGLGFGSRPKGLIPFHSEDPFVLNPFQVQVLQGAQLNNDQFSFHFTIQNHFEREIQYSIEHVEGLTGSKYNVSYSEQSIATNSIAFSENKEVAADEMNELITRPAGHGALLTHLNAIKEEIVFIKNIDNVQHFKNSDETVKTWKFLGGLLLQFKLDVAELFQNPTKEGLFLLNEKYQVYSPSEINSCTNSEDILKLLNRPGRVCGMVKNEGQPGGGPFWVKQDGIVNKQIVEKAQISKNEDQFRLMVQSTHFNPVMIATSSYLPDGTKANLEEYKDNSKFFIVHKQHLGQNIRYMELPGLWNGSMSNWNTLFVEIPSATFSPVKTVLDLLGEAHRNYE